MFTTKSVFVNISVISPQQYVINLVNNQIKNYFMLLINYKNFIYFWNARVQYHDNSRLVND